MQFPYRVIFGEPPNYDTYLVTANDSRQAVRRAMRAWRQEKTRLSPFSVPQSPEGRIRVRSLTPKEVDGRYLPRVGGLVIGEPCETEQEALKISVDKSLEIMNRTVNDDTDSDSVSGR